CWARRLQDLALEGEERALVWRSLRDRATLTHIYNAGALPETLNDLDTVMLEFLGLLNSLPPHQ
ncbi:MAG: hypothetical protein N3A60_09305, partial [Thermanaerothrix sp.]|nr:hypothetical protein [Thermanaerothrix sp.]